MSAVRVGGINANLTKAAANLTDVRELLRLWRPEEESLVAFRDRAIEENLLGKTSRSRTADVVQETFVRRYVPNGTHALAARLRELVLSDLPRHVTDRILYYHAALAERLLYRVATEVVYDQRQRGGLFVDRDDVLDLLNRIEKEGGPSYSDSVSAKLAGAALTALRDFGILEGAVKKRIAPVRVPPEVVGYIVYFLKEEGLSANRIVTHKDWRLFLLTPTETERAVVDASGHGWFSYHAAGSVRRFDWSMQTLKEFLAHVT